MQYTFTSKYRQAQFLLGDHKIKFHNNHFSTDSEEVANLLRAEPEFGKTVFEGQKILNESRVVQGTRSSFNEPGNKEDYVRYGYLQAKLLNKDGTFRKDASEEEINEFQTLKSKLGV